MPAVPGIGRPIENRRPRPHRARDAPGQRAGLDAGVAHRDRARVAMAVFPPAGKLPRRRAGALPLRAHGRGRREFSCGAASRRSAARSSRSSLCAALSLGIILETAQAVPASAVRCVQFHRRAVGRRLLRRGGARVGHGRIPERLRPNDPAVAGGRPHPRPYRGSSRRPGRFSLGGEPRSRSLAHGDALVHAGGRGRTSSTSAAEASRPRAAGSPRNSRDGIFRTGNSRASGPRPFCSDWATGSR